MQEIPTTVFTGFLGSGKTTIIFHLIEKLQNAGKQVVYIKNEVGDQSSDTLLAKNQGIETTELLNGCICCTLVGPFTTALDQIIEKYTPNQIVIEASGAADSSAIALMIDSHPKVQRDGILSVIDVINFSGYQDLSQTARNQTKFTDLLVFNKIEQVSLEQKQRVVGYVRELNETAPIVEAPRGELELEVAFGVTSPYLTDLLSKNNQGEHQHHLEQDGLDTMSLPIPNTWSQQQLAHLLNQLPGAVYRAKGLIELSDQKTWLVNKVGQRTVVEQHPAAATNQLLLIGFNIAQHTEEIQKLISTG